jgi:hypothetical protein
MRKAAFLVAVIIAAFSGIASSESAMKFECGSGPDESCDCTGAADCKDMRKSGMCSGALSCKTLADGQLHCVCDAARTGRGVSRQAPGPATTQH